MAVQVREKTIEEIQAKLGTMDTELNKIVYLESALRESGFSYEIKRFLYDNLSKLFESRKMYERAGKAMANKASMDISFKDRVENYLTAAELYSKAGKVDDAEDMFTRANRDVGSEMKTKIRLARKNIYLICARDLEAKGKRAGAAKFYEKLVKMNLEEFEKREIKEKLLTTYKALGLFREARLLEGL
ncbi:MAG: hypothetical protein ABIF88_02670 [archaeon]